MSIHSQLTSSLIEGTSEDEEKRKEAEKAQNKKKKGLTEAELSMEIDVNLTETKTITLLHIPGVVVNNDTDEEAQAVAHNAEYKQLKQSKIGSDLYNFRGSQTLNSA